MVIEKMMILQMQMSMNFLLNLKWYKLCCPITNMLQSDDQRCNLMLHTDNVNLCCITELGN